MKRTKLIVTLTLLSGAAFAVAQQDFSLPVAGLVAEQSPEEKADSLYNLATDLFAKVQVAEQADPIDNASYFPLLYRTADVAMQAADLVPKGSQNYYALKEMIRKMATPLESGAFYYSSVGDNQNLNRFGRKFIDIRIHPMFAGENIPYDQGVYHLMAYNAACDAFNKQEYDRAIEYFKVYFSTGEPSQRETVYFFMGQAAINLNNYDLAVETLRDGVKQYPANEKMRILAMHACIDGEHGEYLEELVDNGLIINPENAQFLELKGKILEDNLDFLGAVAQFQKLDQLMPNQLSVASHIAFDYYNAAVTLFNQAATTAKDEKEAGKLRRKSRNYFAAAAQKLEEVLASDPTNVRYLRSLGVAYRCMEQKDLAEGVNNKLKALGEDPLGNSFMPPMMAHDSSGKKNFVYGGTAGNAVDVPSYSEYGSKYITDALTKWMPKGEFETMEAYQARISSESVGREYDRLNREAQEKYINEFSTQLRLSDLKLMPYDVNSQSFRVDSNFGPFFIKVPNSNNEAELFKANWEGSQFLNTKFCIVDDQVNIASLTVLSPTGKKYEYSNDRLIDYKLPDLTVDVEAILAATQINAAQNRDNRTTSSGGGSLITALSDVDKDIPVNKTEATNKFVLILANENYDNVAKVDAAIHDGMRFRDYCVKTLGIPEQHVTYCPDASLGKMRSEIHNLQRTVDSFGEPVDVIFYYAGHGMPDEATKNAFLLPVDGDPLMAAETGFSLDDLYSRMGRMNAKSVSVFLDACFSGARRDGEMLASARAVVIQPKAAAPKGNMFIFSAATGQETALPYREKNHGMFTYYLLKKLQETKGNVSLKDLSDYVIANVRRQSTLVNKKGQTPTVQVSGTMQDEWKHKKLRGK